MKKQVYEIKTIGGLYYRLYVDIFHEGISKENVFKENDNILEISDDLNNRKIEYTIPDSYIVKLIRLMNHNCFADGFEMADLLNRKCRKLNIDLMELNKQWTI